MLFNSDVFLFEFLPAVLAGFFLLKRFAGPRAAQIWLALASFIFYASAGWRFLPILFFSIGANFLLGRALSRRAAVGRNTGALLAAGICLDLALLGTFKYANFFASNVHALLGLPVPSLEIVLPIGISFYTFTQIAFLVDAARGVAEEYDLPRYALFVTFYPHLIAGPIIHHKEMMPQFAPDRLAERKFDHLPAALMLFAIGLAKKVILADSFASLASPVFDAAAGNAPPDLITAWGAMLSYTFQIYFDFSGYSDMALGLALMFGIRLPVNFLSPYKSTSIIDFWRTWHMTLSRFLRDYLYYPLGGNRKGTVRRYANLMMVMVLGGLWHGAGWTFVLWGALHGFYLLVNHAWRALTARGSAIVISNGVSRIITFLCVAFAWVLFRAQNLGAALGVYAGLVGRNGVAVMADLLAAFGIHQPVSVLGITITPLIYEQDGQWQSILLCALGFVIVWTLPNSMELCGFAPAPAARPRLFKRLRFDLSPRFAAATALLLFLCVSVINSGAVSEFIYFRF